MIKSRKHKLEIITPFSYRERVRNRNAGYRNTYKKLLQIHANYLQWFVSNIPTIDCSNLESGGWVNLEGKEVIGNLENREGYSKIMEITKQDIFPPVYKIQQHQAIAYDDWCFIPSWVDMSEMRHPCKLGFITRTDRLLN